MTYAYSAVPPSGRALGSLDNCISKDRTQQNSCPTSCLSSADKPYYCAKQCMYNEFGRSMHFMHEYAEYRCLDLCRVNKQLYQEFSIIFCTRNTFEFHNTTGFGALSQNEHQTHAEMIRNVSLVVHASRWLEPISETNIFSFGHSLPESSCSVPSLVVALDHLVKCTGLESLQVGLEYRVHWQLINQTVLDWVEGRNPDKYSYMEKKFRKFGTADALWRWNKDFSATSAVQNTQATSPLYKAEHNAVTALQDISWEDMRKDTQFILDVDEESIDFGEGVDFCAKQIILLHRSFGMYKIWQHLEQCSWIEWPRWSSPPSQTRRSRWELRR